METKTEMVYGVKMTSLENMIFSKYLSNNNISMNTKLESDRTQTTLDWLINHRLNPNQ